MRARTSSRSASRREAEGIASIPSTSVDMRRSRTSARPS
jgi:hypothetical protein